MPDLDLESREQLPDELAYLRALFAREQWQEHPNFGELSRFWMHVHDHLRQSAAQLGEATAAFREGRIAAADYRRFFVPSLNQFLQHLNGHHQIEDRQYFPKFRLLDPKMEAGFALLEKDHERIHEALTSVAESANLFLRAFERGDDEARRAADAYAKVADRLLILLVRHLADEEDLVIPAMLHHGERSVS